MAETSTELVPQPPMPTAFNHMSLVTEHLGVVIENAKRAVVVPEQLGELEETLELLVEIEQEWSTESQRWQQPSRTEENT